MTKFIVRGDIPQEPGLIVKNHLLLCPGVWKGRKITKESILNGLNNTNWNDSAIRSVIYSHKTNNENQYFGDASPEIWVGSHTVPKYLTLADGVPVEGLYADLELFDEEFARKVAYGKMRCGTSAGMEYDYRTDTIKSFINQSIVSNPACKMAYLNLSDQEKPEEMSTMEPTFLNMGEDLKTIERRDDDKAKMDEDKIKTLEGQIKELKEFVSKQAEEQKKSTEPKEDPKPVAEVVKTIPAKEEKKEEKVETPEPKVIERETIKEVSNNKEVVDAINKLNESFSNEIKKVATPATVAQTDPNATFKSSEDEVTERLIDKYNALHPE